MSLGNRWDIFFLGMAKYISSASKDPSTKVGAVVVDDKRRILGIGYNGFPRGIADSVERLFDRETKYKLIVHADENAIINCVLRPEGGTLYVWPLCPCHECAKMIIQAGIKRVVFPPNVDDRWKDSCGWAVTMFREARIIVDIVEIPERG